nr:hypothetical protein HmN_000677400 [Hymenolepis microstoma]
MINQRGSGRCNSRADLFITSSSSSCGSPPCALRPRQVSFRRVSIENPQYHAPLNVQTDYELPKFTIIDGSPPFTVYVRNVIQWTGFKRFSRSVPNKVVTLPQSQERDEMGEETFIRRDKMAECRNLDHRLVGKSCIGIDLE